MPATSGQALSREAGSSGSCSASGHRRSQAAGLPANCRSPPGAEAVSELEDLRRLRYFVAVAEDASFTRAAPRLRGSQPAVSEAIRQLERDLRVTLLMRDRPVAVTAAGDALLQDAPRLGGGGAWAGRSSTSGAARPG